MPSACMSPSEIGRVLRSKQDAKTTYDTLSGVYDLLAAGAERRLTEAGLSELKPRHGEIVFEIGFGAGRGLLSLANSVSPDGVAYGIDISRGMIRATRNRIGDAGREDAVELVEGDGAFLPFRAEMFDSGFMSFSLELFDTPEIPIVLADSLRVLKKGGRFCVVSLSKKGRRTAGLRLYEWAHVNFPKYADCRPICVQESLRSVGFDIASSRVFSMWGLPVEIVLAGKP